jgi:phospholipid/cholesterol/gamma-HCH transport system substrate-binding protein
VKVQLLVFVLLGAAAVVYSGLAYVGFGSVFNSPMKVTVHLAQSGGIFSNAEVSERGVSIGKVGSLKLTGAGVDVELLIDKGKKVPADSRAVVANLSFVGEQFVDLQPQSDHGPYLADGSSIPVERTATPPDDASFLQGLDDLVNSVDRHDMQVVVDELAKAFQDGGKSLQTIIDRGNDLTDAVTRDLPQQLDLIKQSQQVLGTVRETGGELQTFADHLASLTSQIKASDPDLRRLLDNGVASAQQLDTLLKANESSLPVLLSNLVTVGDIQRLRIPGLKQLLITYPEDIRNGFFNAPGDGTSHFGLVVDQNVGVCTKGYESTKRRTGEQTGDVPANTAAACTEAANSAISVRGSRNAPRPAGDRTDPALGGTLTGSSQSSTPKTGPDNARNVQLASWDPQSRLVNMPDGQDLLIERTNGSADLLGKDGWKWLFLGALSTY